MQFKILNQLHEEYDYDKHERLEALYKGGDEIIDHIHLFIPQRPGEHPQVYQDRVACASYINYMAELIDYYTANLFSKPLAVIPADDAADPTTMGKNIEDKSFYQMFSDDADLCGNNFTNVLQKVLTDALTFGHALIGIDFPIAETAPISLAEEELAGLSRAYLYCIDPETLINWDKDDFGKFKWVILKKEFIPQDGPFASRDKKITQFKVWTMRGGITGTPVAVWQLFEIETKVNREPRDNDEVTLVQEGTTSFSEIPILCMEMEVGLWIGNKIGNLCADHFRMRTALVHSENRSLYAAPWYKQGPEFDAKGNMSVIAENANRGNSAGKTFANKGFMVLGPSDEVGFMEPTGAAYELINAQLRELADEIHRVVHQMANSITAGTSSLGRSAASKGMDNAATEIILSEYGELVKEFAKKVYKCISAARNEDIVWQAVGLSNYQIIDKDLLSKEAIIVLNQLNIPSETFKKGYLNHLASAFGPVTDPKTQLVIKNEIDLAVDAGEAEPIAQTNRIEDQAHEKDMAKLKPAVKK